MMADVTEDEILEVCSCITNKIIENLKYFLVSINDFEKKFIDSSMKNSNGE